MQSEKNQFDIKGANHLFLIVCFALCLGFAAWGMYGKLDIVSMANGRVVPSSKVKTIQHLEGGIVREILVKEGDHVKEGQSLMILEEIYSGANVEELQVTMVALRVDIALLAAAAGETKNAQFSKELIKNHPTLVRQARKRFEEQIKTHKSEISSQEELIKQRTQDISGFKTRIKNSQASLELLEKQIQLSEGLLKDQLTTEYKHLNFLREASNLKRDIDEDKSSLNNAHSALIGAKEKLKKITYSFREKAGEKLKSARQELEELSQRLKKYSDSFKRTTIRSPVDGIVKTLYVFTVRGVVKPGMTVMDIVPGADRLIVEARLPIGDVGYVQPGQRAIVKLASRDARRFGKIEGKVVQISPDAYTTSQGGAFYTVRIETENDYFEKENLKYELYPGIQVIAFIHTGHRTVFEYLMDPFLNTLGHSLRER